MWKLMLDLHFRIVFFAETMLKRISVLVKAFSGLQLVMKPCPTAFNLNFLFV